MAPMKIHISKMPIMEIMNPATASPRGCRNIPTHDNMKPTTHISHPATGAHENNSARMESTNPATPTPLLFGRSTITVCTGVLCCCSGCPA